MKYRTFAQLISFPVVALMLAPAASAQITGTVNFTSKIQQIDGFGLNATFGRGGVIDSSTGTIPAQVADLLYNPVSGAGLSILRMGIDTDLVIVPTAPSSCNVTPTYTWDNNDGGEIWMGQQAVKYGIKRFYADSWGAPGYMKTNNNIDSGGTVCDGTSATSSSAQCKVAGFSNCIAAYANYLIQFVKDYESDGVPITDLSWVNEPNTNTSSYASMTPTSAEAITFLNGYGPIVRASGLNVNLICCDYYNWTPANTYNTAIVNSTANSYVDIYSAHEYGGVASFVLTTAPTGQPKKKNWMSEYGPQSPVAWNPYWDKVYAGTSNNYNDGMWLANDISNALNKGQVDAYIYWYPASTSTTGAMIQMSATSGSTSFIISARLNAFAHFARFVHPGAYQVTMTTTSPACTTITQGNGACVVPTAFVNPDGTKVINLVNNIVSGTETLTLTLDAGTANWVPTAYITDGALTGDSAYPTYPQPPLTTTVAQTSGVATVSGTTLTASLPARSMTTIVLTPPIVSGTVQLVATPTHFAEGDGTVLSTITIANIGTGTAQNVTLTSATLGTSAGTTMPTGALPFKIGNIAPGSSEVVNVNYAAGQTPGATVVEKIAGTYTGSSGNGNFSASFRAVVPTLP
jgi:glucosylceramidase